ncbi:hypothetical protein [Microvirga aerilata]|nr:hypothetical protein [Microvirga aerilata]
MAKEIDWEYIFPAVKILFKSSCEIQTDALKAFPKPFGVDLTPAA